MSEFWIHEDAEIDREVIWEMNPDAAASIEVLLQELEAREDLRDRLTQEDYGYRGIDPFNVDAIDDHQRAGRNVWRLKLWNLDEQTIPYRIVYAYDHTEDAFHVLGILPREFVYDLGHERVQQIIAEYDRLDLPYLRRR